MISIRQESGICLTNLPTKKNFFIDNVPDPILSFVNFIIQWSAINPSHVISSQEITMITTRPYIPSHSPTPVPRGSRTRGTSPSPAPQQKARRPWKNDLPRVDNLVTRTLRHKGQYPARSRVHLDPFVAAAPCNWYPCALPVHNHFSYVTRSFF